MKFKVYLKDPDGFYDSVEEACKESLRSSNLPEDEQKLLLESRIEKAWKQIDRWVEYKEYVVLEFDTDAVTATVVENT